ncbi:MAG TPA: glycosyltransferase family 4 protein [Longimicrobiaceae bacterium]|nr:glycosyltransferase family 4 protein [Longimicrobiaceae bacterium]
MRILITTDLAGGVWSYTEELCDVLVTRGHEVALVAFGGEPDPIHRAWLAERPELDFTFLPCPLEWMPEPEPGLSASVHALREVAARFAPDVIHLNQFFYGAFDLGAPKLVVAHSDVVSWWRAVKGEEPPDDPWFRRYHGWVEAGLRGADLRAAPSRWMAAQAEAIYDAGAVRVVYNARSPARFVAASEDEREPLVVAAGRLWDEAKGARDLADAAGRLEARGRVVVAGPAGHPTGGEDFPVGAPGVEWAGVLPTAELRSLLSRAAIYAATSRYEPFGLAPLEAALSGCALVISDIPTFRELWEGCAIFYRPGDAHALADTLGELLDDPERRHALAAAARARALERFHPERMAMEYEALYRELAALTP